MYASERVLKQLASGDHYVVVDERDDTEALIRTIFALRYKLKNKMFRRMNRRNYDVTSIQGGSQFGRLHVRGTMWN